MRQQLHLFRTYLNRRVVRRLTSLFLFVISTHAVLAQSPVTGRIRSDEGALEGVSVARKGSSNATVTDGRGRFTINASPGDTLVFSSVGYRTTKANVPSNGRIDLELPRDNSDLSEVVVVGYNSQKKATLTGSVSVVKGSDLLKSPQPNVSNSLAGRFSGLIINNRGGEPGYDGSSFTIRGLATTGNNDVLIVVDGVPGQIGGLERLNPNDIESLTVLKDASAAIYGSRAANGVILITTKRGKTGEPKISLSYNQGFTSPTRLPDMADAPTYADINNEIAYYNNPAAGLNQIYSEEDIQKFGDGSDPLNFPNTDWTDVVLKKTAMQSQANVSVSGGSDKVQYFLSTGLLNQDGLYKNGVTNYKQYSFRSNIDANVTKDLKVGLFLSGRQENRVFPTSGAGDIFRAVYRAYPTIPAFYPNGLPSIGIEGVNPAVTSTDIGGINRNPRSVFNGILRGSYNIAPVKGLSADGFLSIDKSWNFAKSFATPYQLYSYDPTTGSYNPRIVGGSNNRPTLNESQDNQSQTVANIKLNYNRSFGSHNINSFVGYEQSQFNSETFSASRLNYPSTQTPELTQGGTAATDRNNAGSSYNYTRKSYLGKLAYNFEEKYLAEVQMRIDGSSTFPQGNRFGYFPSFSAGWRISKESWFDETSFINDLKIRGSYGILGNDNVALFQYLNNYSFGSQLVLGSTIVPTIDLYKLANAQISWEEAKKTDIALEGVLFNGLSFELIYFRQQRSDILAIRNASIPQVSGIVNPFGGEPVVPSENIGKVNSNGMEATIGYSNRSGKFGYGISGNFTFAKSKIIFIDEAPAVLSYQRQTGLPLNTYLLYKSAGIFRSEDDLDKYPHLPNARPGDLIYQDITGDGQITADDQVRTRYGNIPEVIYGVLASADYSGFDLSVVFSGQDRVSQYVLPEAGTIGNFYSSWANNRWSPSNTMGTFPRVDTRASASINGGLYNSTFWLNDAAFLRLKNIELGYTFASSWLSRVKLESVRLYLNAFNLFTITKVKDYDPEGNSGSGQFYPQQRIINAGINVYL